MKSLGLGRKKADNAKKGSSPRGNGTPSGKDRGKSPPRPPSPRPQSSGRKGKDDSSAPLKATKDVQDAKAKDTTAPAAPQSTSAAVGAASVAPEYDETKALHPRITASPKSEKNNIMLMTDGYKFSHHKQYPVSWVPEHARPEGPEGVPKIIFPPTKGRSGTNIRKLLPVPAFVEDPTRTHKVGIRVASLCSLPQALDTLHRHGPPLPIDLRRLQCR